MHLFKVVEVCQEVKLDIFVDGVGTHTTRRKVRNIVIELLSRDL